MHKIRLIGLVLFITTAFLAMATAVTQTTHIRFKRPTGEANANLTREPTIIGNQPTVDPQAVLPPASDPFGNEPSSGKIQFVSVPVIYPLLIVGMLGLMMWFFPAPLSRPASKRRKRRR